MTTANLYSIELQHTQKANDHYGFKRFVDGEVKLDHSK